MYLRKKRNFEIITLAREADVENGKDLYKTRLKIVIRKLQRRKKRIIKRLRLNYKQTEDR